RVLMRAGLFAAPSLAIAGLLGALGSDLATEPLVLALLLFGLQIAYQGVRLGRSTHIVDMATPETRAAYTALSNTLVGLLLVGAGLFGLVAEAAGPSAVLGLFTLMCLGASWTARGLDEVQAD
ncbi:MAG: MFS transporter, partial [Planctomycetota bacterium]